MCAVSSLFRVSRFFHQSVAAFVILCGFNLFATLLDGNQRMEQLCLQIPGLGLRTGSGSSLQAVPL